MLSSEPGEPNKDDLFGLQKTFRLASRKCFFSSTTCSYPLGGVIIKCSSMVVSVKDSVSWTLFVNPINLECFFPWLLLVVEQTTNNL